MLTVYLSLTFWGTPEQQYGKEGDDFMITCNVRADPTPIVSWYANGSIILEGPRHTITEDGLFIRSLRPTDAGNYTCRAFVVTPHSSQMKDRNILLHVHYRPVWHVPHLERTHGILGTTANLTCAAHSQPPPVFEWFRDRTLLGNSPLYRIINEKWRSVLTIHVKESSVFGNYLCVVSNSLGEVHRAISLIEGVIPDPPDFILLSYEPGILIVKFTPSSAENALPILGYRIQWRLATDSDWRQARYHRASIGNEFVIHDLSFESAYSVRVSAHNAVGYSNFSEEIVQRTKGLLAETVVDGSSVSSSYNSALSSMCCNSLHLRQQVAFVMLLIFIYNKR
ncbi:neural cell adhesion molecule 1-like isoform X2 [Uloborus diversus]|nr:neural cell adhesion molecule 1-like isoform X2 [Uloborus diversus]